jgi:hypothetical protein
MSSCLGLKIVVQVGEAFEGCRHTARKVCQAVGCHSDPQARMTLLMEEGAGPLKFSRAYVVGSETFLVIYSEGWRLAVVS